MAKAYQTADIDIDVETRAVNAALKRLLRVAPGAMKDIVFEGTKMFVQSATKESPVSKHKKRTIEDSLETMSEKWRAIWTSKAMKKEFKQWKVLYRRASGKKGFKLFRKKGDANRFAKITTRGVVKAGWGKALPRFGQTLRGPAGKIKQNVTAVSRDLRGDQVSFTITNKSYSDYWKKRSTKWGLRKAKNRINGMIKKAEQTLKKTWGLG